MNGSQAPDPSATLPHDPFINQDGDRRMNGNDALNLRILRALRQIIRAVDVHSRHLSAVYRVTGPQLICLLVIVEKGPITSAELARAVHVSPSTLVGILDRLEAREFILRKRDTIDRRKVYVVPTDTGSKFARDAPSPLQDTLVQKLTGLSHSEQASIAAALEQVAELMGAGGVDAPPVLDAGPIALS
ncbi:MAG: MarR family transcriptional regulator [Dehalococcoidia bacterium]